MPLYCGNKKYGIVKAVKIQEPSMKLYNSPYADENGKFVKPAEWDDIESIQLDEDSQEIYYLFDNTRELSFISIRVTNNAGASACDYGRIRNGVFEILETETKNSGGYYQRLLSEDFPNEDYIVARIRPTVSGQKLLKVDYNSWNYNGRNLSAQASPIIMRYGNMPYAQTINCATSILVSDNVMNCKAITTASGFYSGCSQLVRHRHTGWDGSKIISVANMFNGCNSLSDCDTDFSGWCTNGGLTTMTSFMYNCYSLGGDVNVTGWDTSKVTTISNIFSGCYRVTKFIGIEDWNLENCGTIGTIFGNCHSLYQNEQGKLDLTKWNLAKNITTTTSYANFFSQCRRLKEIDISTFNISYTSSINSMFSTCYLLEKISLPDNIGSAGLLTVATSAFLNCSRLKEIDLSKIDFSQVTTMNTMLNNTYCLERLIPPTTTPAGSSGANTLTTLINYAYVLESLDMSWLDCSKFSNATSQFSDMFRFCNKLKNLIPPININNTFIISNCNNLTRESIVAVLNNLSRVTSAKTITLGGINLVKLTADDIAIATGKGWTVA